eukprot:scaffold1949_cov119-Cylindrotheca_fusiformis.AAC.13
MIMGVSGFLTIVASPTIVTVNKQSRETKVGLALAKTPKSSISVHRITKGGLFDATDLQVGQEVVAINGKRFGENLQEAINRISECIGDLTIVALDKIIMKD